MTQLAESTDPFQEVLDAMTKIVSDTTPMTARIDSIRSSADSVESFLESLVTVNTDLSNSIQAMTDVQAVCAGLDEVPGLDIVTGLASQIIGDVLRLASDVQKPVGVFISEVVVPAQDVMARVKSGLDKLDTVLDDVVTDVRIMTNTITILQALSSIATGLVGALPGSPMADQLNALLAGYSDLRSKVVAGVAPIEDVLTDLEKAVDAIKVVFDSALAVEGKVGSALAAVGSVSSILNPIRSGFTRIEDAIAPIRWALDAVSCIVNKVVTPVIHFVLEATHLSDLLDPLEAKLKEALHLDDITEAIGNGLTLPPLSDFRDKVESIGNTVTSSWGDINAALSAYSMNSDQSRREAINQLIGAISNDPAGGGGAIARWPSPGAPVLPPTPVAPRASVYLSRFVSMQSSLSAMQMNAVTASIVARAVPAPVAPLPPLAGWLKVTALQGEIEQVLPKLSAVIPSVSRLATMVAAMPGSTALPDVLAHQLSDIQIAIQTAFDVTGLLRQLPGADVDGVNQALGPIVGALSDQLALCATGAGTLAQLASAVLAVQDAVTTSAKTMPEAGVLTDFQARLLGWSSGAEMLARSIDSAVPPAPGSASAQALQEKQAQLNARCDELLGIVTAIGQSADGILLQATTISKYLDTYVQALIPVAGHAQMISAQGQASADEIANLLKTVNSLLSPLSAVMNLLCPPSPPPARVAANEFLQTTIKIYAAGAVSSTNKVQQIIDSVLSKVVPLPQLNKDAGTAVAVMNAAMISDFVSATKALGLDLSNLGVSMENDRSYTLQVGSKPPLLVNNKFIDAATGVSTIALSRSLAAPTAATPLETTP